MDREKTMTLVLLDLCAFACSQGNGNGARRDFETACRLAETLLDPGEALVQYRPLAALGSEKVVSKKAI